MPKSADDRLSELHCSENLRREKIRVKFVAHKEKGHSIVKAARAAGISPSTYYAWNSDGDVSMKGGWSKGGSSKGGGSKGGGSKGGGSKGGW